MTSVVPELGYDIQVEFSAKSNNPSLSSSPSLLSGTPSPSVSGYCKAPSPTTTKVNGFSSGSLLAIDINASCIPTDEGSKAIVKFSLPPEGIVLLSGKSITEKSVKSPTPFGKTCIVGMPNNTKSNAPLFTIAKVFVRAPELIS